MTQQLDAALSYLARGWAVLPMSRKSKKPIIKWKEFQTRRPTEAEVRGWWQAFPRANVGIITGAISGIAVLDEDGEEDDPEAGARSIAEQGGVPDTLRSRTRKGFHHLFLHPGGDVRNFVRDFPGLDFRGDGGYIIAPPSVHETGHVYAWEDEDASIAPLPGWLLKYLQEKQKPAPERPASTCRTDFDGSAGDNPEYVNAAIERELGILASAPIGLQNEQLNKSAFAIGQFVGAGVVSRSEVEAMIEGVVLSWPCGEGQPLWTRENMRDTMQSGLNNGANKPRLIPEKRKQKMLRGRAVRAWVGKKSADEVEDEAEQEDLAEAESGDQTAGAYRLGSGRTYLLIEKKSTGKDNNTSENNHSGVVWDGAAHIEEEITDEDGLTLYKILGRTKQGRQFRLELEASKFADPKAMLGALSNMAGANCVFAAGMEKHLAPSIKSFTGSEKLKYGRRFNRVGWLETPAGREFLIPGLEAENTAIVLNRKLPYELHPESELMQALSVFDQLFQAQRVEMTSVAITALLQAPLNKLAGWQDERYALFVAGRTGSLKTSWTMQGMAMYGPGFAQEDHLVKFGQGATNNSIMQNMTRANDLPFLVDNYKPGTGGGAKDIINLIHASLEGGEKDRLNRDATQRAGKAIRTVPVFTGEDVPDTDAASIARVLIVVFTWLGGKDNPSLTFVQDNVIHLSAIGRAWIEWLLTPEAEAEARRANTDLHTVRSRWAKYLRVRRSEMVNISRVASNLATNELAFRTALKCPALYPILSKYIQAHAQGLEEVANGMALYASESSEGARWMEAIRSLITTKRVLLVPRHQDFPEDAKAHYIGWEDERGVYLVPEIAYQEAAQLLKENGGFNGVGKNTIHKQLSQANALASEGKDGPVTVLKCGTGNRAQRVLHIRPALIYLPGEDESEEK